MLNLNDKQKEKLADLFMDLAKGLLLGGLALPIFTNATDFLFLLRTVISGSMCVYFSLWLIGLKGVQK